MGPQEGSEAAGSLQKADFLAISHPGRRLHSAFPNPALLTRYSSYYRGSQRLPNLAT